MTSMAGAAIPTREQQGSIRVDTTIEAKSQWRYVWFPGDTIKSQVKFAQPDKRFGGLHRPEFLTLKYDGNDGMIYRCAITALKPGIRSVNRAFLPKADREGWLTGFTLVNGEFNPSTGKWEDVQVPRQVGGLDYLLYKRVFPGDEVLSVVSQKKPNGEAGAVELTPLQGATPEERDAVQLIFFPNWKEIQQGKDQLPESIKALEQHIQGRLRFISKTFQADPDTALKYQTIGQQMLSGCQAYRNWGIEYVKYQDEQQKLLTRKGVPYQYPELSETLMKQLELVRKDELANVGQDATSGLTAQLAEQNELKRQELNLKERAIALRERELSVSESKQGKPKVSKPKVAKPTPPKAVETETEVALPPFAIGDNVLVKETGVSGNVEAKMFGKYKVQFKDAESKMFKREELY